jgi:hypothetical protein
MRDAGVPITGQKLIGSPTMIITHAERFHLLLTEKFVS